MKKYTIIRLVYGGIPNFYVPKVEHLETVDINKTLEYYDWDVQIVLDGHCSESLDWGNENEKRIARRLSN